MPHCAVLYTVKQYYDIGYEIHFIGYVFMAMTFYRMFIAFKIVKNMTIYQLEKQLFHSEVNLGFGCRKKNMNFEFLKENGKV